jgi:hypothetical protein
VNRADVQDVRALARPAGEERFAVALLGLLVELWVELERLQSELGSDARAADARLDILRIERALLDTSCRRLLARRALDERQYAAVDAALALLDALLQPDPAGRPLATRAAWAQDRLFEQVQALACRAVERREAG